MRPGDDELIPRLPKAFRPTVTSTSEDPVGREKLKFFMAAMPVIFPSRPRTDMLVLPHVCIGDAVRIS